MLGRNWHRRSEESAISNSARCSFVNWIFFLSRGFSSIPLFNDVTLESSFLSSLTTDSDPTRDARVTTFKCRLVFWGSGPRSIPFRIRDTTDRLSRRLARLPSYVCNKEWRYTNYEIWSNIDVFQVNNAILFSNIIYFWKCIKYIYALKYECKSLNIASFNRIFRENI